MRGLPHQSVESMIKQQKILLVALGFIVLVAAGLAISALFSRPQPITPPPGTGQNINEFPPQFTTSPNPALLEPPPTPAPLVIPPGNSLTIDGVQVNNFYAASRSVDSEGTLELTNDVNFSVLYYPQDESFLITITNSPFENYRQQAESVLLTLLGVSETEACRLTVSIGTPAFANPDEAGKNYPLSFCSTSQ